MSTLILDIIGRDRGAEKLLTKIAGATDKSSDKFQKFGKIVTVAGIAAGAALVKFGKDSVQAYSEAQQSQLKLQDAFSRFPKLADTSIGALRGLNSELAKKTRFDDDATASGQAVLAQFQLTGRQITQLTPLLQDYAAKTGRDLPAAAQVLGKAMMGNGRALKQVGINFKDTGDRGKNFDQIMGGLRTQVGGFAEKEGKTAAGQIEILKNQFGELQEEAGSHLLPVLTKVVGGVTDAVIAFGQLEPGVKGALGGFAVALPTLLLAAGGIAKVVSTAKGAKTALDGMSASAKKATIASAGVGAALGIAAIAFGAWAAKNAEAKQATSDLTDALVASNGAIDQNIRNTKAKALQDDGSAKAAEELGISLDTLTRAHLGEADAIAEVNAILDNHIATQNEAQVSFRGMKTAQSASAQAAQRLKDDLEAGNITLEEARKRANDLTGATQKTAEKQDTLADKSARAHRELDRVRASMFKAAEAALQLQGSEDGVESAIDDATASIKENGKHLDNNTEKGRNNRQALRNIASASNQYRQALIDQKAPQDRINKATDDARESFIKLAQRMGLGRKEAGRLADQFGLTRRKTDEAARATRGYDRDINALNNKTIKLTAEYRATATKALIKAVEAAPGSERSGIAQAMRPIGGPTRGHSINSMIGGPASPPNMEQGGPTIGASNFKVTTPGLDRARRMGQAWDDVALAAYSPVARSMASVSSKLIQDQITNLLTAAAPGAPGGSVGTYSAGMAATIARLRAAGARSFTSYPGHHPSQAKARDVTPHSWRIANTARASSGVWYVIYQMRIASKNHGNTWRQYVPHNHNGDWQHRRHVHVAWYDKGGLLRPGWTMAYNGTGRNERVTPAGSSGNTYIINAPNYVGDKNDLVKALTDLDRQGRLAVVRR